MIKNHTNKKIKPKKSLKMTVVGYDAGITEESTKYLIEQLKGLNFKFVGPTPLPTKRKVVTLLISPHKHHAAQEQFCRDIHRRVV
jgi:small subunit ribosomal protein S10